MKRKYRRKRRVNPAGALGVALACLAQVSEMEELGAAQRFVRAHGVVRVIDDGKRAAVGGLLTRRGRQRVYNALNALRMLFMALLALEDVAQFAQWKALMEPAVAEMNRKMALAGAIAGGKNENPGISAS